MILKTHSIIVSAAMNESLSCILSFLTQARQAWGIFHSLQMIAEHHNLESFLVLLQVGSGNKTFTEIASIYDTKTNTFEPFHIPEAPFCGAQTILPDGRAILVGGALLLFRL
jgi:hypothetical protein